MRGGGGEKTDEKCISAKTRQRTPTKVAIPSSPSPPPPHREKSYITFNFSAKVSRLMTQRRCSLRGKISRSTNKDRCFD
jgi:hypothetical protein